VMQNPFACLPEWYIVLRCIQAPHLKGSRQKEKTKEKSEPFSYLKLIAVKIRKNCFAGK